jgi:hypothetical protein
VVCRFVPKPAVSNRSKGSADAQFAPKNGSEAKPSGERAYTSSAHKWAEIDPLISLPRKKEAAQACSLRAMN